MKLLSLTTLLSFLLCLEAQATVYNYTGENINTYITYNAEQHNNTSYLEYLDLGATGYVRGQYDDQTRILSVDSFYTEITTSTTNPGHDPNDPNYPTEFDVRGYPVLLSYHKQIRNPDFDPITLTGDLESSPGYVAITIFDPMTMFSVFSGASGYGEKPTIRNGAVSFLVGIGPVPNGGLEVASTNLLRYTSNDGTEVPEPTSLLMLFLGLPFLLAKFSRR